MSFQDILDITVDTSSQIRIKLFQLGHQSRVLDHTSPFNDKLYNEIVKSLYSMSYKRVSFINEAKKLGEQIYNFFFTGPNSEPIGILESIHTRTNPLILLFNGPIENIPFELAFKDDQFVGLIRPISRIFSQTHVSSSEAYNNDRPKSMVILADPTQNSLDSYEEGLAIYKFVKEKARSQWDRIDFLSKELGVIEMNEILEAYDWIHYAGHGEYQDVSGGGLILGEGVNFYESDLSHLGSPPDFIFLNACHSSRIDMDHQNSLIKKLLALGVKNLVASNGLILDEDFKGFVESFYEEILLGKDIGESFRKVKGKNYSQNDYKWIYFSLYGDPSYQVI